MNTEQMTQLLDMLTINEVHSLAVMAKERETEMQTTLIRNAEQKFIEAYKTFRALAPNSTKDICWEYENQEGDWEEQDFDLYDMLDHAFEI